MPSLYRIYFSRDSTVLSLPINPEKLPETKESNNGEYNVLGLGPIMQPRTPKLRKVTISGLFPGRRLPWMSTAVFLPPSVYITFFKSAMDQKRPIVYTPVRYYENGTPFLGGGMGFECLVTSFKTEERGGETGDFYFDLTITEYKDFSPQKAVLQGSSGNFSPAATTASSALNTVTRALSAAAVATSTVSAVKVILTPARSIQSSKLYVGAQRKANGKYYSTSTAPTPAGTLSGQQVQVRRIVSRTNPHPYCVQDLSGVVFGWMPASDLTEVNR